MQVNAVIKYAYKCKSSSLTESVNFNEFNTYIHAVIKLKFYPHLVA
jgi:hypothetical protein